jgi:hypothetical protein
MNIYVPDYEKFTDGVDFGPKDPCTWVVYPGGCAGDLLASIINFHYVETTAKFRGLTEKGQVIFRPSDLKYTNKKKYGNKLIFDNQFFYDIAESLSRKHFNWSKMDHFIFSNHYFSDHYISQILEVFENCRIVRLLPRTFGEQAIIDWLSKFKNTSTIGPEFVLPHNATEPITSWSQWADPRLLTVFFGDLVHPEKFTLMYKKIQELHGFPGPMITYNFVKFWIDHQSPIIREYIIRLTRD